MDEITSRDCKSARLLNAILIADRMVVMRKTLRVLCNTEHDVQHSSERYLYEHVKSHLPMLRFHGSKLLIHSITDNRFRSGGWIFINLATLAFWKRKELETSEPERIIPLPPLPKPTGVGPRAASEDDVNKAKGALKVLLLERQIIGSALTTIFESETKGIISQTERDRLVDKYKVDLQRLNSSIEEHQRTVDLYELGKSREELIKDFNTKMAEMDEKLTRLRNGKTGIEQTSSTLVRAGQKQEQATDAEKRVEQIRDEVLKAMDRLEQIESEG